MIRSRRNIPVSANLTHHKTGTIHSPGEPNHGKHASIEVWHAYCSHGYKSNYERVPVNWLVIEVDDNKPYVQQFSGKQLNTAVSEYESMLDLIV